MVCDSIVIWLKYIIVNISNGLNIPMLRIPSFPLFDFQPFNCLIALDDYLRFNKFLVFGSLQTSLLCIVGELAGGGSVTVAVGVSDRWHATCDT